MRRQWGLQEEVQLHGGFDRLILSSVLLSEVAPPDLERLMGDA